MAELSQHADESTPELKDMTEEELSKWLNQQGIPTNFCKVFEDNYIDGSEFVKLTECEVKEMVPPIGLAKKIIRLIPKPESQQKMARSFSPQSPLSPFYPHSEDDKQSTSTTVSCTTSKIVIPDHWREETTNCIDNRVLDGDARSDVVRTLVTLLVSKYGSKPGKARCEEAARSLILKYPFMADDLGCGYTSWVDKMLECIRNREKQAKKKARQSGSGEMRTPCKRQRLKLPKDELFRRYPAMIQDTTPDDAESVEKHQKAMMEEMTKAKPRVSLLIPLMKSTYHDRRVYIQSDDGSLDIFLERYPALALSAIIEHEMGLVLGNSNAKLSFEREWAKFVPAIISYGEKSRKKGVAKKIADMIDTDDTSKQLTAVKILVESLTSGKSKEDFLCYIYEEFDLTTRPEDVCSKPPLRSAPWIAAFIGEAIQYFIIVEHRTLCQVPTFQQALYITFCSFYVFHLEYPKQLRSVYYFFQDYILSHPDSSKRPGNYLAIASDIKKLT